MKIFQILHSAEENPKSFPRNSKTASFSELETSEKTNLPFEKNVLKKYLVKVAEKPKERRFLQTESFNEIQTVPFERIQKFSKKVA